MNGKKQKIYMQIQKRDGRLQALDISKIVYRIDRLIKGTDDQGQPIGDRLSVDANSIALEVCQHVKDGIKSTELDEITAEICAYKLLDDPEYNELAKRLIISNNHKNNREYIGLRDITRLLHTHDRFSQDYLDLVEKHGEELDREINFSNDYLYLDFFGFKTLEKNYLIRATEPVHGCDVCERPQHLWMRVALEVHRSDLKNVIKTYQRLSQFYYIHATPTLFNSGHKYNQLSSCFLNGIPDSIDGMYETVRRLAHISKNAGGIGCWISDIRGNNAVINSSGGKGSGIVPYIRSLNDLSRHVDQGGKRKGSIALYIELHHPDIFEFLDLRKNTGNEEFRTRDIFLALFITDLFMSRVKQAILNKSSGNGHKVLWSLMCPKECPGLTDLYGEEYAQLYMEYESQGRYLRQVDILVLWDAILDAQMETSLPYMLYKDSINEKSNQKNLGTIKSSNLCAEIVQYSSYDEYSSCNLSSICLPKYVDESKPYRYDLDLLADIAGELTRNLNRVIDQGYTPTPQIKKSNLRHRPIGIGVQGLSDVFFKLGYPYESDQAQELNRLISEAMYYGAVRESVRLAAEHQQRMSRFAVLSEQEKREVVLTAGRLEILENDLLEFTRQGLRSPTIAEQEHQRELERKIAEAKARLKEVAALVDVDTRSFNLCELQYWDYTRPRHLWGTYPSYDGSPSSQGKLQFDLWKKEPSGVFDWGVLRRQMAESGLRNSLLIALMPTASTAQIMGNNECFEPITSNIYTRSVLSGNFIIINKHLQRDLLKLGLWNQSMKNRILRERGSVQRIEGIPQNLKEVYKTSWEISKKTYLKMSAERGCFIDQSQSLNLFIDEPTYNLLTTVHLYGWELGLKTGMYYLRRKTVSNAQQFTITPGTISVGKPSKGDCNDEVCISCQA
jgi:ribonucleoside-diphosphate reductase alpha subunit